MPETDFPEEDASDPGYKIISLSVCGFKSIKSKQSINLRPLTLLAGANSSGKSSMMQPLLLLKQTLEAPYDPGPLLLEGPNVRFTSLRQVLHAGPGQEPATDFAVTIGMDSRRSFEVCFGRDKKNKHVQLKYNRHFLNDVKLTIKDRSSIPAMMDFARSVLPREGARIQQLLEQNGLSLARNRFFYEINSYSDQDLLFKLLLALPSSGIVSAYLLNVVHLPGLRGRPERAYSVAATGRRFPGSFENYVAGLISHWASHSAERLSEISDDLRLLGLTSKIDARRLNDTQVELRVARTLTPGRGAARDLISIADVGLGVSQTLPVVVALRAAGPGQLVYIEQPEVHLHPRAQVALARLLVNAANRGVRVVAETHSSLILLAVQTLVAEGVIEPGSVGLNWFLRDEKDGTTRVETAELDEAGRFGDWPEDFDEVTLEAESRYLSAAEGRLAKG